MANTPEQFINEITAAWRQLEYRCHLAEWEVATTGQPEAGTRLVEAEVARNRYFGDPQRLETANTLLEQAGQGEALMVRSLRLIQLECLKRQAGGPLVRQLAAMEA